MEKAKALTETSGNVLLGEISITKSVKASSSRGKKVYDHSFIYSFQAGRNKIVPESYQPSKSIPPSHSIQSSPQSLALMDPIPLSKDEEAAFQSNF